MTICDDNIYIIIIFINVNNNYLMVNIQEQFKCII